MDDPLVSYERAQERFGLVMFALLVLFCLINLTVGFTGAFFCLPSGHRVPRGLRNASKVGSFLPPIGLIVGSICMNMNTRR